MASITTPRSTFPGGALIAQFAPFSANLRIDYFGNQNTTSLISADMTIGAFTYTSSPASNTFTTFANDTSINTSRPVDAFVMTVNKIAQPMVSSLVSSSITFRIFDQTEAMFSSDTPIVDEFLAMPNAFSGLRMVWEDPLDLFTNGFYIREITAFLDSDVTPPPLLCRYQPVPASWLVVWPGWDGGDAVEENSDEPGVA